MSALRGKVLEQAILTELRLAGELSCGGPSHSNRWPQLSKKALRERVSDELGPVGAVEFEEAIRSLRYQGKLHWAKLDLAESMKSAPVPPLPAPDGPEAGARASGPDDDDDYPSEVNDQAAAAAPVAATGGGDGSGEVFEQPSSEPATSPPLKAVHASSALQGRKLPPAPAHESEVQRAVRGESEESFRRRVQARSIGQVKAPLEIRRVLLPEPTIAEAIQSAFASEPHDLIVSLNRKHPELWRRVIALGRATGKRPAAALYECIEAGLEILETGAAAVGVDGPRPQKNAA